MARLPFVAALLICFRSVVADTGGPYLAVPDLKPSEVPPVFAIPGESRPLRFFLGNMPELRWNKKFNEPDSYSWRPCTEHHASVASLGPVGGREILCIRYISHRRIDQGLDFADALLLVAREYDTAASKPALCSPILYTVGGPSVYDHAARWYDEGTGTVRMTRVREGRGAADEHIYIRGSENGFERFIPGNGKQ